MKKKIFLHFLVKNIGEKKFYANILGTKILYRIYIGFLYRSNVYHFLYRSYTGFLWIVYRGLARDVINDVADGRRHIHATPGMLI
jgi:hypothetical protein